MTTAVRDLAGEDSRLHFEAPADGTYLLRVSDVRGLEGERFAYRLTAREPALDYSIAFDPRSFNILQRRTRVRDGHGGAQGRIHRSD